jgi:regulator of RNase E activity RraA
VVVEAGGDDYALAGGNVCAVAQRNGIAGFVLDGAVRDVAEIRGMQFPVFCRGGCSRSPDRRISSVRSARR